jgi:hypothetical protein
MSGYVFATGRCINCGRVFSFNPHKVPSTSAVTGSREPVCRPCFDRLNAKRVELGLEPWPMMPGAYEPMPEEEL